MDRIAHSDIEEFKQDVLELEIHGLTVREWARLCNKAPEDRIRDVFSTRLGITEDDPDTLVQRTAEHHNGST